MFRYMRYTCTWHTQLAPSAIGAGAILVGACTPLFKRTLAANVGNVWIV